MLNDSTLEKIENYLDGKLSAAERQALETELARDEEFARQFEAVRDSRDLSDLLFEDRLREKFRVWDAPLPSAAASFWKWAAGAVLATALLFAVYFFWEKWQNQPTAPALDSEKPMEQAATRHDPTAPDLPENHVFEKSKSPVPQTSPDGDLAGFGKPKKAKTEAQKMAAAAAEKPDFFKNQNLRGEPDRYIFQKGIEAIEQKNWQEARRFFEKMEAEDRLEGRAEARFAFGYACFFEGDYVCAERQFVAARAGTCFEQSEFMLLLLRLARFGGSDPELRRGLRQALDPADNDRFFDKKLKTACRELAEQLGIVSPRN